MLPRDWKEHGFLGMALVLPARGRVVPRPFCASLDPARVGRQSPDVSLTGGKAQPVCDWWLKQPMNAGRSRCSPGPESNGP